MAVVIVATVPSHNVDEVRDLLVKAAQAAGCQNPRVAIFSDFPGLRVEMDCQAREEGYL